MPNRVKCGSCDSVFQVPDGFSGRRGKCPKCGAVMELPGVKAAPPKKRPADEPSAAPAVRKPPVKGVAPAAAENPAAIIVTTDSTAGSFTPSASAGTGSSADATRYRRRSNFPAWAWVLLAVGGMALVGLSVFALMKGLDGDEVATSNVSGAAETPGANVRSSSGNRPNRKKPPQEPLEPIENPNVFESKAKVAHTLEEAKQAIVKFETPLGGGTVESGTGFFINEKGWVATNCHVIEHANKATRAKMAGDKYSEGLYLTIEGIIARVPEHDLAIVKLRELPPQFVTLDIGYDADPSLAAKVYVFGHPMGVDFSLTIGNVNNVLMTHRLPPSARNLVGEKNVPGDFVWVQHDAKILPGNSGGPVFLMEDETIKVIGVNTFVNLQAEFGYAGHVRYLRKLAAECSGEVTALPPAKDGMPVPGGQETIKKLEVVVDSEKMQQLYEEAKAFDFKPQRAEQYEMLAELAKMMTFARIVHTQNATDLVGKMSKEEIEAAGELAEKLLGKLREVKFGTDQIKALNKFGAERLDGIWDGVFVCPVVKAQQPGMLFMHLEDTNKAFFAKVPHGSVEAELKSRWLILGYVSAGTWPIETGPNMYQKLRVINSQMMVQIK